MHSGSLNSFLMLMLTEPSIFGSTLTHSDLFECTHGGDTHTHTHTHTHTQSHTCYETECFSAGTDQCIISVTSSNGGEYHRRSVIVPCNLISTL